MSKLKTDTRNKILDKALEMFNERGIEYVGLRELAAILDMRVSNITYYFPTKDDLVFALSAELAKENSAVIKNVEHISILQFLEMLKKVYYNHLKFKGLLLSIVHTMKQNSMIRDAYKKTQTKRKSTIKSNLQILTGAGYLKIEEENLDYLVSAISLISRFWISEAEVSLQHLNSDEQVRFYLILVTKLLLPYSTSKGKKEIEKFVERL
jgi:AcrR family transcriptional regulator